MYGKRHPVELQDEVRNDMERFITEMDMTDQEIKNLRLRGVKAESIRKLLIEKYL